MNKGCHPEERSDEGTHVARGILQAFGPQDDSALFSDGG
jgi:hypothetical protein